MSTHVLQPVTIRHTHLDILRGFALLGILLVNFEWFIRPLQAIMLGTEPGLAPLDAGADALVTILGEGKFYPIFSILFGAGFALMAERAMARAAPFWRVYFRRLLVLLGFGLVHSLLIWSGDILLIYAIAALVMILFFRNTPERRLWKWALAFIFLPLVLMWAGTAALTVAKGEPEVYAELVAGFEADEGRLREDLARAEAVHASGSFVDNIGQRIDDTLFKLTYFLFWATPIIGYFLIGRWLIVSGRLTQPREHQLYFRRWRARGLSVGLVCAVAAYVLMRDVNAMLPNLPASLGTTLATLAGLLMALGYLSAVTLSAERLRFLAPVGQMALTNYLAQSLVWTWVIYGHGLGLWGELPRWSSIPLAFAFFGLQIVFSQWWMARYRFGPAEWLWRTLTYGQRQGMRRSSN